MIIKMNIVGMKKKYRILDMDEVIEENDFCSTGFVPIELLKDENEIKKLHYTRTLCAGDKVNEHMFDNEVRVYIREVSFFNNK